MIAWLIALSSSIFKSAFTVRLFAMLSVVFSLYLLQRMVRLSNTSFFLLVASIPLLQVMSSLAIPDAPLMLAAVCYFFYLKKFIDKPDIGVSLLLSLAIALLIYSKYHGILLIASTLLAYPSLLKSKYFYVCFISSLLLLSPHIYWQISHNFPSISYHLYERDELSSNANFGLFLGSQILTLGPILLVYLRCFKAINWRDAWQRVLHFCIIGTIGVFSINAMNSWSEAHWTIVVVIPMLISLPRDLSFSIFARRSLFALILMLFVFRISLSVPLIPKHLLPAKLQSYYQKNQHWAKSIQDISTGDRTVFMNSYPEAALYNFYTDESAYSWNDFYGRKSQYNIWLSDRPLSKESVTLIPYAGFKTKEHYLFNGEKRAFINYPDFKLYPSAVLDFKRVIINGKQLSGSIKIKGLTSQMVETKHADIEIIAYQRDGQIIKSQSIEKLHKAIKADNLAFSLEIPAKATSVSIGIKQKNLPPSKRGRLYHLEDYQQTFSKH